MASAYPRLGGIDGQRVRVCMEVAREAPEELPFLS